MDETNVKTKNTFFSMEYTNKISAVIEGGITIFECSLAFLYKNSIFSNLFRGRSTTFFVLY